MRGWAETAGAGEANTPTAHGLARIERVIIEGVVQGVGGLPPAVNAASDLEKQACCRRLHRGSANRAETWQAVLRYRMIRQPWLDVPLREGSEPPQAKSLLGP